MKKTVGRKSRWTVSIELFEKREAFYGSIECVPAPGHATAQLLHHEEVTES